MQINGKTYASCRPRMSEDGLIIYDNLLIKPLGGKKINAFLKFPLAWFSLKINKIEGKKPSTIKKKLQLLQILKLILIKYLWGRIPKSLKIKDACRGLQELHDRVRATG